MHAPPAPLYVTWTPTLRCTRRCPHCFVGVLPRDARPDELSTKEAVALIDTLVDGDVYVLNLGGGEVLLREDVFELAAHARSQGMAVVTSVNGDLVDATVARRLRDCGFQSLQVSLDGARAETHDALRGAGSYRNARTALTLVRDAGMAPALATAIHRGNRHELGALIDLAHEVTAVSFKLQLPVDPFDFKSLIGAQLSIREAIAVVEEAKRRLAGSAMKFSVSLWYGLATAKLDPFCAADFRRCHIDPRGRLSLCEQEPGTFDVLANGFATSWVNACAERNASRSCACTALVERARLIMSEEAAA